MKKILLAIAVLGFGTEHLVFLHPLKAFMPLHLSAQHAMLAAVLMAVLFLLASLCLIVPIGKKTAPWFPAGLFFLLFIFFHLPLLFENPRNGSQWTVCFELIAIGSGAMAALSAVKNLRSAARLLFGISLIVFSCLHFIYADFIATLIPGWLPYHLFWSYFFGCTFLVAGISFLLNRFLRIAGILQAAVFFIWVACLHLPRCFDSPRNESEWTSLFVAFALGMSALIIAIPANKPSAEDKDEQSKRKNFYNKNINILIN